jgi:GNAT superfamily N-acetyltransferase
MTTIFFGAITMEISYTYDYIDTDIFEEQYELSLREDDREHREAIIKLGLCVYMYVDGILMGECFGITPYDYLSIVDGPNDILDADMSDEESIYVYSTTILPEFRGQGYGKILRKEFGRVSSFHGYAKLIGHATSPSMVRIAENLGAIFRKDAVHPNWFGSSRTAYFYTQFLTQTNDYNCGPFALSYLLESKGHTYTTEYLERALSTNPEKGTDPHEIIHFLCKEKIPFTNTSEQHLRPDSIIDITVDTPEGEDGHWVTIARHFSKDNLFQIYDPAKGLYLVSQSYLQDRWYSPRYGEYQGFTLL